MQSEKKRFSDFSSHQYNATVSEDWKIGHEVAVVSAYSLDDGANGQLRYAISGGNERGKFSIDSRTGEMLMMMNLPSLPDDTQLGANTG